MITLQESQAHPYIPWEELSTWQMHRKLMDNPFSWGQSQ